MFSMSEKSVPGCLVLMAPSGIGVPVAATPGLVPHDEVLVDAAAALVLVLLAEVDEAAGAAALLVLLLLLLLPQPAIHTTTRAAAHSRPSRTRGTWWYILTDLLLLEDCVLTRPRGLASRAILMRGLTACNST